MFGVGLLNIEYCLVLFFELLHVPVSLLQKDRLNADEASLHFITQLIHFITHFITQLIHFITQLITFITQFITQFIDLKVGLCNLESSVVLQPIDLVVDSICPQEYGDGDYRGATHGHAEETVDPVALGKFFKQGVNIGFDSVRG